eukprot:CAMPEP_0182947806 /NCGR_PEP_ID=MMETSP0105_2-20130417/59209_1 /TAXON_ID=81532 ORGANISM="Acanthoeca-like sp., Strain 10tr" /NCGR_SAMPLE_ID=MMETSP0105_2 /ASSEMBLY_ACC=CAM_ASM_000205 /LENGTH=191 /DNA_ID=CAMNT_0025088075 /DNA_START=89 /DNA_END=661 /DNA_ORIENTATION=-
MRDGGGAKKSLSLLELRSPSSSLESSSSDAANSLPESDPTASFIAARASCARDLDARGDDVRRGDEAASSFAGAALAALRPFFFDFFAPRSLSGLTTVAALSSSIGATAGAAPLVFDSALSLLDSRSATALPVFTSSRAAAALDLFVRAVALPPFPSFFVVAFFTAPFLVDPFFPLLLPFPPSGTSSAASD